MDKVQDGRRRASRALLYVIEKLAREPADSLAGGMLATLSAFDGERGVSVTVDWPKFLGVTEPEILAALADYYLEQGADLARRAAACPTEFSQMFATAGRAWLADEAARQWAGGHAAETWAALAERNRARAQKPEAT